MSLRSGSRVIKALLLSSIIVVLCELVVFFYLGITVESIYSLTAGRLLLATIFVELVLLLSVFRIYSKRKLVARINVLATALERGAEGDLTIRVPVHEDDEIAQLGHNLNLMLEKLGEFVNRVNISLNELRGISFNTTDAAEQLVQASGSQSAAVNETSHAVSEINGSIDALSREIDTLTRSAARNSGAISTMTASLELVGQNIDSQSLSIEEVSSSIVEVAAAVRQIAGNVNNLMATATTTAASVAQLDATIKQVEQNAQGVSAITENVRHDALVGQESVAATISGIGEINDSTQFTLTAIDNLSSRVKAIGNILLVINELADQTNLLALNSAIIAAQAGEHGKGFAVVSDQIKRLAMRTRNSTQEIADLITGIQKETGQVSEAIKTTGKRVAEGVLLSKKSGDALQKIVNGMEKTLGQVNDIAATTVEQARGSQQIRQAMEQVSEMVSKIATSTQDQGSTSGFIISSVDRMKELTEYVKTSSHEQRTLGLEIAGSTDSITGIVGEVERLRNDLSKRNQMIRMAIQQMQEANNADLAVVKVMEEGVENLSRQISIIQDEMAKLKVA